MPFKLRKEWFRHSIDLLTRLWPAALALATWWALAATNALPVVVLPHPLSVMNALIAGWSHLASHATITLEETLAGFLAGSGIGWGLSVVFSFTGHLRRALFPYLITLKSVPLVALAPLIVALVGSGLSSKIILAALISFFPVLISSYGGLTQAPPEARDLILSLGANRWEIFWNVELPGSLPRLMDGLKVSVTFSLIGAIVGEFVGATQGLGYLVKSSDYSLRADRSWAAVIVIGLLGVTLFKIVEAAETKITARFGQLESRDSGHPQIAQRLDRRVFFEQASKLRVHRLLTEHASLGQEGPSDFFGMEIALLPTVFSPTIGEGSQLLARSISDCEGLRILDMGTGSGGLALLAAHRGAKSVVAVDVNLAAALAAKRNAQRNGSSERVLVVACDCFSALRRTASFDLVLLNPPFLNQPVASCEWGAIYDHDYRFLREFLSEVRLHLTENGRVFLAFSSVGDITQLKDLLIETDLRATVTLEERSSEGLEFFVLQLERTE